LSEPPKNSVKGFIVLSDSAGHGEFQKSLHKSDPWKRVNLHILKMAASETFNAYYYVLMVDFAPYKCISNRWENGVSESNERIFIHL